MKKESYFQGTEEPTPGKKKYKSDPAILIQPRFKEPFYRNYDYIESPGGDPDKPAKHGPGAGYTSMQNFKSVKDFLAARRKKLKNKYKAEDSWIQDDGSVSKKAQFLKQIIKLAIDFPRDESLPPYVDRPQSSIQEANPIGVLDPYLPKNDLEGKPPEKLNFGRDYQDTDEFYNELVNKYLDLKPMRPASPPLLGLPDGLNHEEFEEEPLKEIHNPDFGTTNVGNLSHKQII